MDLSILKADSSITSAIQLLGKELVVESQLGTCSGIITEVEAYEGIQDRASHAFGGKLTDRTRTMYASAGTAYIYLCYGIHNLFNIVCSSIGDPKAVLIRSLEPRMGIEEMQKRRGDQVPPHGLCRGPGNLSKALGIDRSFDGMLLNEGIISLRNPKLAVVKAIYCSPRIGVDYAGSDANLPYRFYFHQDPTVSGNSKMNETGQLVERIYKL